jgi:5-amino-6-(5-phosphoribosylamino)uracil reductase
MRVTLCMAMTADGKIAPPARTAPHFGAADAARFEEVCARADALVVGAGSLRAQGATRTIVLPALLARRRAAGRPDQPLTCVVSASGELDLGLPFFARQQVPRAIATTAASAARHAARYAGLADVWACGEQRVEPTHVLARLAEHGVRAVTLLGGGALNADFFAADLVDTIELTLAPVLFGGASAPTPLDGLGLPGPRRLLLTACEPLADGCLFLTYQVCRMTRRSA